jgi:hypothetical protein
MKRNLLIVAAFVLAIAILTGYRVHVDSVNRGATLYLKRCTDYVRLFGAAPRSPEDLAHVLTAANPYITGEELASARKRLFQEPFSFGCTTEGTDVSCVVTHNRLPRVEVSAVVRIPSVNTESAGGTHKSTAR